MNKPWLNADKVFQHLKASQLSELDDEQKAAYKEAETAYFVSKIKDLEAQAEKSEAQKEELQTLKNALLDLQNKEFTRMKSEIDAMRKELKEARGKGEKVNVTEFAKAVDGLKGAQELIKALESKDGLEISLKADATYADLTNNGELNQLAPGIIDAPKRKPKLYDLFSKIPFNKENYTYYIQKDDVTRDAQGVAKCVKGFSSLTKEELEPKQATYVKVKDAANICIDYMDDYDFVEARYNILIKDSVEFKIDDELLLGTDTVTSTNSINAVSSEFSATNADAPIGASIQDANGADLALGMAAQIDTLGKLASYQASHVLVNRMDWFVKFESAKDREGRYLDPRISKVNGRYYIGELLVLPLVNVAPNTMYVFDSSKGFILDRKKVELKKSTENGTNFLDEYITIMATVKLNFLAPENYNNAFMKCSDVDAAIDSITEA